MPGEAPNKSFLQPDTQNSTTVAAKTIEGATLNSFTYDIAFRITFYNEDSSPDKWSSSHGDDLIDKAADIVHRDNSTAQSASIDGFTSRRVGRGGTLAHGRDGYNLASLARPRVRTLPPASKFSRLYCNSLIRDITHYRACAVCHACIVVVCGQHFRYRPTQMRAHPVTFMSSPLGSCWSYWFWFVLEGDLLELC
ncbi:hypothetical protein J6590_057569 [Homalodisca vitripennis]|nr:hypothetical protein J6590_057569 [Homalodisca vitripennis]